MNIKLVRIGLTEMSKFFKGIFYFLVLNLFLLFLLNVLSKNISISSELIELMCALYDISILVIIITSLVVTVIVLYRDLCSNEAMFTFTLPIYRREVIVSKIVTYFISLLIIVGMCLLSSFLMNYFYESTIIAIIKGIIYTVNASSPINKVTQLIFILLFFIILIVNFYSMLIAALSLGQAYFDNKLLGCVLVFIILNYASHFITFILALILYSIAYLIKIDIEIFVYFIILIVFICNIYIMYKIAVYNFKNKIKL